MPEVNVFIESSFFSAVSGSSDTRIESFFKENDSIGSRGITFNYVTSAGTAVLKDVALNSFLSSSGLLSSGVSNVPVNYILSSVTSGTDNVLLAYNLPVSISGGGSPETIDTNYVYNTGTTPVPSLDDTRVIYTVGNALDSFYSILANYWMPTSGTVDLDYETKYTAGGIYDPLISGSPLDQFINYGKDDIPQLFTSGYIVGSGIQDAYHDVFFVGYPMEFYPEDYTYKFHLATGDVGTTDSYDCDLTVISGAVQDISFNILSTLSGIKYINSDSICGVSGTKNYYFDAETIDGTISYYFSDLVCGVSGTNGFGFDIDLFSLRISNFSLDVEGYTQASGIICVDVTDDVYNVVTSGTYFVIDGTLASGTFDPITDGYRMCYDPINDFEDFYGNTEVVVHAQNDNGDVLAAAFYLTSGYIVEYKHRINPYDYDKQVVVRGVADNLAGCPETGVDAYWFTTVPKISKDLGATIVGVPWGEKNLSASITPTTDTIYFYGKVFRIEVRAKDFAGNVMQPYIFEFKIEDMPE